MNFRERQDLDRHITSNWGEDSVPDDDEQEICRNPSCDTRVEEGFCTECQKEMDLQAREHERLCRNAYTDLSAYELGDPKRERLSR